MTKVNLGQYLGAHRMGRRDFLGVIGVGLSTAVLAACGAQSTQTPERAFPTAVKPVEAPKPAEQPKPVEVAKPAEKPKPDPTAVFEQRVTGIMRERQANPTGFASDDAVHDEARRRLGTPVATTKPEAAAPAKPAEAAPAKPVALAPVVQAATGSVELTGEKGPTEALKALESWANARGLVLTVDETEPSWPNRGQGVPARTTHNEEDLEGNKVPGRSVTELRTGTRDFGWMSGGRFAFIGTVNEALGQKDTKGRKYDGSADTVVDSASDHVLFVRRGSKVVIPGGADDYLRGNVVFVLGVNNDNTSGLFETDSASNYYEKRNIDGGSSAKLNEAVIDAEGMKVLAAMAKVAANSMFNDRNCKGNGCKDAVGVYVVRGGDKTTGKGVQLLWGAVYTGQELAQIKLKNQQG